MVPGHPPYALLRLIICAPLPRRARKKISLSDKRSPYDPETNYFAILSDGRDGFPSCNWPYLPLFSPSSQARARSDDSFSRLPLCGCQGARPPQGASEPCLAFRISRRSAESPENDTVRSATAHPSDFRPRRIPAALFAIPGRRLPAHTFSMGIPAHPDRPKIELRIPASLSP